MDALTKLVESAAQAKKRLVEFFDYNARTRHGVPLGAGAADPIKVEHEHRHKHEGLVVEQKPPTGPSAPQPVPAPVPEVVEAVKKPGMIAKALPWLLSAGIPLSGLAGWGAAKMAEAKPETVIVDRTNYEGSLLQHLEDHGRHLPGNE